MATPSRWAPGRAAADYLGISERTLQRWRSAGLLKAGEHYRRKYPAANSPLLYQLERCEQAMSAAFARDFRTLELVEA
jgi:predicted site-specific integrase-resolvase